MNKEQAIQDIMNIASCFEQQDLVAFLQDILADASEEQVMHIKDMLDVQ